MTATLVPVELTRGDLIVVNSARVSFLKSHAEIDPEKDPKLIRYLAQHNHWSPFGHAQIAFRMTLTPDQCEVLLDAGPAGIRVSIAADSSFDCARHFVSGSIFGFYRLLHIFDAKQRSVILRAIERRYPLCAKELQNPQQVYVADGDPYDEYCWEVDDDIFSSAVTLGYGAQAIRHATATVHVKAPIYVARQLVKHQVDLVWNEVSRRYVDLPLTFADQPNWSERPRNAKQGAAGPATGEALDTALRLYDEINSGSHNAYDRLVRLGIAPEQARTIQTLASETEWYWTGTVDAFARVCKLRLDKAAQKETSEIAKGIDEALTDYWGEVWKYAR